MLEDRDYMRSESRAGGGGGFFDPAGWTPVKVLLTANIAVFVLQHFFLWGPLWEVVRTSSGDVRVPAGGLSMEALQSGRIWTLVTHLFVHSGFQGGGLGFMHLLGNLLILFFAGRIVQNAVGWKHVYALFFGGGLVGAFLELLISRNIYLIGASGGAFAVLVAALSIDPERRVIVFFPLPIELRMRTLRRVVIILTAGLSVLTLVLRNGGFDGGGSFGLVLQTAHFAHLGGVLVGLIYARRLGFRDGGTTLDDLDRFRRQRDRGTIGGTPGGLVSRLRARRRPAVVDAKVVAESEQRRRFGRRGTRSPGPAATNDEEYDAILDKVNQFGFQSLTESEKEVLHRASERMRRSSEGGR